MTHRLVRALTLGLFTCLSCAPALAQSFSWAPTSQETTPWNEGALSEPVEDAEPMLLDQSLRQHIQNAAESAVETVMEECTPSPRIALTFDDGPFPGSTENILATLRHRGVPATFFLVGQRVKSAPALVGSILEDGHEVAVHSHTHADLSRLGVDAQAREIQRAWDTLHQVAPHAHVAWWRAPYGALKGVDMGYPKSLGMEHMGWSIDTLDWQAPDAPTWMDRVLSQARDGSVVLMHDHAAVSRRHLGELIDELWARGFVFRTLSGLSVPACYTDPETTMAVTHTAAPAP